MTKPGLLAASMYVAALFRSLLMENQQQFLCCGLELLSFSLRGAAVAAGWPSQSSRLTGQALRDTSV